MFLKTILWGFFLFGIVFLGDETRKKFLIAKLDAEHLQASPLSIHKSGTILKFTADAEFEIPLLPAITTAYQGGYSESLISYLSHHHQEIVPFWETPAELRFELDMLTNRMIQEREFTVVNNLTGERHTSFKILPETKEYFFAYAYEDGRTFFEMPKEPEPVWIGGHMTCKFEQNLQFQTIRTRRLCKPWYQGPDAPLLTMTLEHAEPDLSAEFLHILANSDPTIY